MHELGVTQSIFKICMDNIDSDKKKVEKINLIIGELSGYIPEVIQHYFKYVSRGTPCAGALIEWKIKKAGRECGECGEEIESSEIEYCPKCLSSKIIINDGRDILVDWIEIE